MAVEVAVGYVRWVGVWARAWEGRAARRAEWDGMAWKERATEWADGRLRREPGEGPGRRARLAPTPLYYCGGVGLRFAPALLRAPQFHQYLHKRSVREGHCIWLDLLVS
jgi:hypothetical protein